jgi:DNA-directed RNA polymerase subunit RPC12/RpoP
LAWGDRVAVCKKCGWSIELPVGTDVRVCGQCKSRAISKREASWDVPDWVGYVILALICVVPFVAGLMGKSWP